MPGYVAGLSTAGAFVPDSRFLPLSSLPLRLFSDYLSISSGKLSPPDATLQKTLLFWQAVVAGRLIGRCLACQGQLLIWVPVRSALGGKHG